MEIRRTIGNRALPSPALSSGRRGPACLWPHACFDCRKSWKLSENSTAQCPECQGELHWMGRAFKVPKKADDEQWTKVRILWLAGFRFVSHTRWRDVEPYPERLREVDEFVRHNPIHPFRIHA